MPVVNRVAEAVVGGLPQGQGVEGRVGIVDIGAVCFDLERGPRSKCDCLTYRSGIAVDRCHGQWVAVDITVVVQKTVRGRKNSVGGYRAAIFLGGRIGITTRQVDR